MSSDGAVSTASDSRGFIADRSIEGYKIILPTLPTGVYALNSVFLHADIAARPYRIEDFKAGLEEAGVLGEIAACGSYQMKHVWMVTLKSLAAKQKLVAMGTFEAKGRRCLIIDPDKTEVRLKLHWIPFHVPDEPVKTALEAYGKVEEIARETWRVKGLEGVQSTTRVARLILKEGVTLERLPHTLRLPGCMALVLAHGRAPLCLRCRRTGHIRKECRVPRCDSCRRYGNTKEDCRKTYAAVANAAEDDTMEHLMDQEEAEAAAAGDTENSQSPAQAASTQGPKAPSMVGSSLGTANVPGPVSCGPANRPALQVTEGNDESSRRNPEAREEDPPKDTEGDMEATSASAKRPLEATTDGQAAGLQEMVQQRWQVVTAKKGRLHAAPRVPSDSHKTKDTQ
ncbi:uncharacterized protein ISCGN_016830 [Ixodes scapularis]